MRPLRHSTLFSSLALLAALPSAVVADQVLTTNGFQTCLNNASVQMQAMNVQYDNINKQITFDIAGSSSQQIPNVTGVITFTAYGQQVYTNTFNPCAQGIQQLCPVPQGNFAAQGNQSIPPDAANKIPSIAFNVPDLDGQAQIELKDANGEDLACIQSNITNGKSLSVPAITGVAVVIAAGALALSSLSALMAGGQTGTPSPSPTFSEVIFTFQSFATNGMLSVNYPAVYQSFTRNFAFSTLLIPWSGMQTSIDNFRQSTGGNLTDDNFQFLHNVTIVDSDTGANTTKRALSSLFERFVLFVRDTSTSVNGSSTSTGDAPGQPSSSGGPSSNTKQQQYVSGLKAYAEELTIPDKNTFMTVLLIFLIIIAAITVAILLFKVILEVWALFASFPKKLTGFRKRYWWVLSKTITQLVLLLYGVWTLYCIYQFTNGDSWAAKVLAGVTLGAFTAILAFFSWRIWVLAHRFKRSEGDTSGLYEDKDTWVKYSLFYDNYKRSFWWIFVPAIVYMFAKNCIVAAGQNHGMIQAIGQIIVDVLFLGLLIFARPYSLKSGNWINIIIQIVRVLSVVFLLVFVEELGFGKTTQGVMGIVLVVVQSVLSVLLGILVAVNAVITCCRENPHRKQRKEAEKLHRDLDNLTPLSARNSLLLGNVGSKEPKGPGNIHPTAIPNFSTKRGYAPVPGTREESQERLVSSGASMGRSASPAPWEGGGNYHREPRLPSVETSYHSGWGR